MNFATDLIRQLSGHHLLKHPFYQAWSHGELSRGTLKLYAEQYHAHVNAFPRYVSGVHARCEDLATRQGLLENLIDEERGEENHPELWARFAEGLGVERARLASLAGSDTGRMPETQALVGTFLRLTQSSYGEGLGALFAYEHQFPEIAKFKLDGLARHYGLADGRSTAFFKVHMQADVHHTRTLSDALDALPEGARERARAAARACAEALWGFLDGMERSRAVAVA